MKMKPLLLSFDLEPYEKAGAKGFDIGYEGGKVVQEMLERVNMQTTFFVTTRFYQRFPDFVGELSKTHEIAFHGLNHTDDYQTLSEDEAFEKLMKGKNQIEKKLHQKINGFRAPRMRPPSYTVLKKAGFVYSSSLHPTYVPGRYNHFRSPRSPFVAQGVLEIPVSVASFFRLPLSWVWFRQLGKTYAQLLVSVMRNDYLCIYFHPWEFVSLKHGGVLYTRNTGKKMEHALEQFLNWISSRTESVTMVEFARETLRAE